MTYVISDLHGYLLEKLKKLLGKAGFCDDAEMFILGNVVDRNGDGGETIIRKNLLAYCRLDTLAMVKVLEKLYDLCDE